jgi:chemotaxis protein methyltransferase CheR
LRANSGDFPMRDAECVSFLQWALPLLGFRWRGFRKVRRQVCKRISRRCAVLGLENAKSYRDYLETHDDEWTVVDDMCRITISRFCRDRALFQALTAHLFPVLAAAARARGDRALRCWSAGCASGEEPYSLAIAWQEEVAEAFPDITLSVVATDTDPVMLARAQAGRYQAGSLKDVPENWRSAAFEKSDGTFLLRGIYRAGIAFERQDIREACPPGPFDLVLCRNLAFTYFDDDSQRRILARIVERIRPGGVLVIGAHEVLPGGVQDLAPRNDAVGVFQKAPFPERALGP